MIDIPKTKKAFTLIELTFTILIIGILANLAIPHIKRDLIHEASTNILSDIRYTQHLAVIDNKHSFNHPTWQRKWWKIGFQRCTKKSGGGWFQTVSSDLDMKGDIDAKESAKDPSNGLDMDIAGNQCQAKGINPRMLLSKSYSITKISKNTKCNKNNMYIGFDYLGRPHSGYLGSKQPDYASYISENCILTFTLSSGNSFQIQISTETGYAFIIN